jgi:hypothetical protein
MTYISAKEQRIIDAWSKRGLAELRIKLLMIVEQSRDAELSDNIFVDRVSVIIWSVLPRSHWHEGEGLIRETLGLIDIDIDDWKEEVMTTKMNEEELREELGKEEY